VDFDDFDAIRDASPHLPVIFALLLGPEDGSVLRAIEAFNVKGSRRPWADRWADYITRQGGAISVTAIDRSDGRRRS
jgi:hypothetical protein